MFKRIFFFLTALLLGVQPGVSGSLAAQGTGPFTAAEMGIRSQTPASQTAAGSGPVMFVENAGQFPEEARFRVYGGDRTLWLAEDAIWVTVMEKPSSPRPPSPSPSLTLPPPMEEARGGGWRGAGDEVQGLNLRLTFPGANPHPRLEPFGRMATSVNYFLGSDPQQWHTDVPVWRGVRYVDLYPGVDLEVTGEAGRWNWRLVAAPDADLAAVRLRVEGAEAAEVLASHEGETYLRLNTAVGAFNLPLLAAEGLPAEPAGVQMVSGGAFEVTAPFTAGAAVGDPHPVPARAADGSDLAYATFLGGSDREKGVGIAVDGNGAAYITGYTYSDDFPTTPGAFDTTFNGGYYDAFVVKLSPAGDALAWATFLGGSDGDGGVGIAVDGSGAAYVMGSTESVDFPTTPGAFDTTYNGGYWGDAFVVKLNSMGNALAYATFLGGSDSDVGLGIAVDGSGAAYVTGETTSADFPATPGAFDTTLDGCDAFAAKLNPAGDALLYATFFGGSRCDDGRGIAVDASGAAYITGWTGSADFPATPGAFDTTFNGYYDAFAVKLNPAGDDLAWGTYLGGGSNWDDGRGIAVDGSGAAYITGWTRSADFPTTSGAFDTTHNGYDDTFAVKLSPAGDALLYATFLGGSRHDDRGLGIAVDGSGAVYITGWTTSADFPATPGAFDTTLDGWMDAYAIKLSPAGDALLYATFLGGNGDDYGSGIAVDGRGTTYITGDTYSAGFPTTPGAFDTTYNGGDDAFVLKLAMGAGARGYSISGQVVDGGGSPIPGVTVSDDAGHTALTDANGEYTLPGLLTGTYTLTPVSAGWVFTPTARRVTVTSTDVTGQDFIGYHLPVIVLVHGFQGTATGSPLLCDAENTTQDPVEIAHWVQGWEHVITDPRMRYAIEYWGDMPGWLAGAGYDIWVAQLKTGHNQGTATLEYNGTCLRNQIAYVAGQTRRSDILVVAHSMGGLVSRSCLSYSECSDNVNTLVTLGSPHAGLPERGPVKILKLSCKKQPGACEMGANHMVLFNRANPNSESIDYHFIGGDGTSGPRHWQQTLWEKLGAGPNDGLIGKYSAVGWVWDEGNFEPEEWADLSPPSQYWTDEFHSRAYSFDDGTQIRDDYYHTRYQDTGQRSHAYECFMDLLAGNTPDTCTPANTALSVNTAESAAMPSQSTPLLDGTIASGQVLSTTQQVDSNGQTIFYTAWHTGTLAVRLRRPDGQVIDPSYAASHPEEVSYTYDTGGGEMWPFVTYSFTNTLPGIWTIVVDASSPESVNTDFWAFAILETERTLHAGLDAYRYAVGDTAALTATLQNNGAGLAGITVTAQIARFDGVTDTLTLTDQGGGNYAAAYTIPDAPGYLNITVLAEGDDNGTPFARQTDLLAAVAPQDAQFTGAYGDRGNDANADGFYESLDVSVGVTVVHSGTWLISGQLLSAGGDLLSSLTVDVSLDAGTHTVTLPFNGDDIRLGRQDGPYTLSNLQMAERSLGIPAQIVEDAYVIASYSWRDFGTAPPDIYLPLVTR